MRNIKGFSLMEMVIIIVILGILSIADITRFMSLIKQVRTATLIGTSASIRSVTALAILKYTVANKPTANTVEMNGTQIAVHVGSGVPLGSYDGIGKALHFSEKEEENGFKVDYSNPQATILQPVSGGNDNCRIIYNSTNGDIQILNSGC